MCSGVKGLALVCLGLYGIKIPGCDDDAPPPEPPARTAEEAPPKTTEDPPPEVRGEGQEALAIEAAAARAPRGAVALAEEAARFQSHERCVASAQAPDALLRDTLEELGLASAQADACRVVEAVHDKSAEPCKLVVLDALRVRCQAAAAIASQAPDRCPPIDATDPARGRDVFCLALAGARPASCDALEASDALACRAAALQSRALCMESPTAVRRRACERTVERWRGLTREARAGDAPNPRASLVREGSTRSFDELALSGAVIVEHGTRRKLSVDATRGRLRLSLRVRLDAAGHAELERLTLVEGGVTIASAGASETRATVTLDEGDAGSPSVYVALRWKASSEDRFEIRTSLRDLVRSTP